MAGTKPGDGEKENFKLDVIARSEADEANQTLVCVWIASLALAMTALNACTALD
jgi:hypothetical protein